MSVSKRIEEVVSAYYRQMKHFQPKERELIDWFLQLPHSDKTTAAALYPDSWPELTRFQRYYLEKHGYSMAAYMAEHLTEQELAEWMDEDPNLALKQ